MPDDGQVPPGLPPPGARQPGTDADLPVGGRLLPIRPMSVGDVLDGAFGGLRATFVPVALIVVAILGPLQLCLNLLLARIAPDMAAGGILSAFGQFDEAVGVVDPAVAGIGLLFGILSGFVTLFVTAASIGLLLQVDRGEPTDTPRAMRGAWQVFATAVGASVILGLVGIVGAIVFVLVAVLIGVAVPVVGPIIAVVVFLPVFLVVGAALLGFYSLVVPIVVVERRGVIDTLGRGWWVLRRRFWRLVGITVLIGLLVALATFGLQLPLLLLSLVAGPFAWIVESVGEVVAQVVVIPVTAFAAMLVYLDARVRYEGLDLVLRTRDIRDIRDTRDIRGVDGW